MNRQKQTKNTLETVTRHETMKDYHDTEFGQMNTDSKKVKDCCEDNQQSYDDCKKTTHKTNR